MSVRDVCGCQSGKRKRRKRHAGLGCVVDAGHGAGKDAEGLPVWDARQMLVLGIEKELKI